MSHYRSHVVNGAAFIVFVVVGVVAVVGVGASPARDGRSPSQPKSASATISYQHHQPSASTADAESFNPLPAAAAVRGVAAFPDGGEPVFVPTLPLPEKLVLEQRHPAAQKLYPNFFRNIPPLGHSRPYYQPNDAIIDQRYNGKIRVAAGGGLPAGGAVLPEVVTAAAAAGSSLLGSGDFGVIKGGTFYYDTDVPQKGGGYIDDFYGLGFASNSNNGHGRPQLAYLVQKAAAAGPPKEEQFSNFRDFADINISNDPAYSQQAPRYLYLPAPKDAEPSGDSRNTTERAPDNILDELRSLDRGSPPAADPTRVTNRDTGVRAKLKKDPLLTVRKKRPKTEVRDQQPDSKSASDGGDDYMVAAS
ncbi:uncharacterized protein LOC128269780 [Anopheles cruzii]|uniref:uncharacterized protein LOC128269780 n=1 Tax=Anopheles cruzii TaxID=68878 RepID=UPI0022EC1AFA|nr:uncharacterized protein LOC128269780 [Anopheles cruzii]